MKDTDKVTLTVGQLKRLISESILNESDTDLDISNAINSNSYEMTGRKTNPDFDFWRRETPTAGKPWVGNARMFTIHLYQKDGDRWLNLYIDFLNGCYLSYFYSDRKILNDWDYKTANRIRKPVKGIELVEITPEFLNEIKSNSDLQKVIEKWITFNTKNETEDVVKDVFARNARLLDHANAETNNDGVEMISQEIGRRNLEKEIIEYANEQQEKLGRKYSYYKEYYRGEHSIAHDDDYEGSGETSLGSIAVDFGCKTKEDVDDLIERLHRGSISDISGNYRYIYS